MGPSLNLKVQYLVKKDRQKQSILVRNCIFQHNPVILSIYHLQPKTRLIPSQETKTLKRQ